MSELKKEETLILYFKNSKNKRVILAEIPMSLLTGKTK